MRCHPATELYRPPLHSLPLFPQLHFFPLLLCIRVISLQRTARDLHSRYRLTLLFLPLLLPLHIPHGLFRKKYRIPFVSVTMLKITVPRRMRFLPLLHLPNAEESCRITERFVIGSKSSFCHNLLLPSV